MFRIARNIIILLWILIPLLANAQSSPCSIQLKDANSGLYLSYAHVSIKCMNDSSKTKQTSDKDGFIFFDCHQSFTLDISHIGYETFSRLFEDCEGINEIELQPIASFLPEFVLTAQHKKTTEKESVYSINTIHAEKINYRGASSIHEVLNSELNTRLSNRPGWSGSNVNLQGFSGEQVNIMVDGVPVSGRLNGNIDLQQINLNNIEKIEILNGPVSVVYGSNSSGGAINIISKVNDEYKFRFKTRGYYESVGQYNFSGNMSFHFKNNYFTLGGGRNFFGGYSPVDTSRNRLWPVREQYFGDFSYLRKFRNMELKLTSNLFFEETIDRGEKRPPHFTTAFDTYYNTQRHINRLQYKWKISDDYALDVNGAVTVYKRDREKFFRDLTTLEYIPTGEGDTTLQLDYYLRPVFARKKDKAVWNFQSGFEMAHSKLNADRIEGDIAKMTEYAFFFNTFFYPFKNNRFTINPGIRYIYNNNYKAPLVYALNVNTLMGKEFSLKASVAKGFRTPTIKELYLDFPYSESIQVFGNKDLKAEISRHVRLAVDWQKNIGKHFLKAEVAIFFNDLDNMITTAQVTDTKWMYVNIGNFKSLGYNTGLKYKNSYSDWFVGLNYTGFRFSPDQENNDGKFFYSPEVVVNSTIVLPVLKVAVNNTVKYSGKLTSRYLASGGTLETSFIGSHTLWDLSLSRKFWEDRISLVVGIKNILDVVQVPIQGKVYGYNTAKDATLMPVNWGRTAFASLILDFFK